MSQGCTTDISRFPYIDTLKILEKWGPGCLFYGHGSSADIDDLEEHCKNGEKFLALFCEFPGNPLLKSPDLHRLRSLADKYEFAIVVDETIGNFLNVHVLPFADVIVSSLTKVFSGDSNVMGGRSRFPSRCTDASANPIKLRTQSSRPLLSCNQANNGGGLRGQLLARRRYIHGEE